MNNMKIQIQIICVCVYKYVQCSSVSVHENVTVFQHTISLNKLSFVCTVTNLAENEQKICTIDDQN